MHLAPAFKALPWLLLPCIAAAQGLSDSALNGPYHFRHLQVVAGAQGAIQEARTSYGAITFNGSGGFTFTAQQIVQSAAPAPVTGSGQYRVSATGEFTLTNPQRSGVTMNGRMSEAALVASSTEAGGGLFDLLIAFPAPASGAGSAALNGSWWLAGVGFPQAAPAQARTLIARLDANAGLFSPVTVNGQAANLGNRPATQLIAGAAYSIAADGTGTASFPIPAESTAAARLLGGNKTLHVSRDGNFLLLGSHEPGGHELLVGVRAAAPPAGDSAFQGLYFSAGLQLDSSRFQSHAGAASATGAGAAVVSRRARLPEGVTDFTGVQRYSLQDGSGFNEIYRMALGAGGNAFLATGVSLTDSNNYALVFGFRAPSIPATPGVFLHPHGVVNAAGFAPSGNPIAPGAFVTLFGAGLAPRAQTAAALPFPTNLAGVQVLVNDRAAPVYAVSPTQISFLVPQATPPGTATIVADNGGARSNAVQLRVAATAPGVFSLAQNGIGPGAVLHSDFTVVGAGNPARRGETVLIYLTGLGAVTPPIPDGAAAPANPLSTATVPVTVYIGGVLAPVTFRGLAPGFAGLYQLNATVPAAAPGGASVPLAVETPDSFHDQVDIAIAP